MMAKSLSSPTKGFFRTLGYDPTTSNGSIHNRKSNISANNIRENALTVDLLSRPHTSTSNIQNYSRKKCTKSKREMEFWKKKLSNKISPDQTSKTVKKSDGKYCIQSSPEIVANIETVGTTEERTKTVLINKSSTIRSTDNLVNIP